MERYSAFRPPTAARGPRPSAGGRGTRPPPACRSPGPGRRRGRRPGRIGGHRLADPLKVGPEPLGDRVELVGDREADGARGVGEELAQLGLDRRQWDDLDPQPLEQRRRPRDRPTREAPHDRRQPRQLFQGITLGDPFRTIGDVDVKAPLRRPLAQAIGDSGEDRAAEDEQLPITHPIQDVIQCPVERMHTGAHEFVHRRSDRDDHDCALADDLVRRGHAQPPVGQDSGEDFLGAALEEGHPSGGDLANSGIIDVE